MTHRPDSRTAAPLSADGAATEPASGSTPLLVDARDAAQLCGVSPATWYRMAAAGRTPAPVRLSPGCVRYSRETLAEWVRLGCPPRKEFEARRAAANGRT